MPEIETVEFDITSNPEGGDIEVKPTEAAEASDQESKETEKEETTPSEQTEEKKPAKKSNKSNFKKLAKANKEKDRRIAELEAKLAKNNDDIEEEDDDIDKDKDNAPAYDKVDLLEFLTDNEGAGQYKKEIIEALEDFPGISFEKALQFAQAQSPKESESYESFSTKSAQTSKKKKLTELTPEEVAIADLSPEQFDAWSAANKKEFNPFS